MMMAAAAGLPEIVLLSLLPAAGLLAGGGLALAWRPGAQARSAIQHFTAGVVIAAVAVELVPELHVATAPLPMALGFLAGIAAMLALRRLAAEPEETEEAGETEGAGQAAAGGGLAAVLGSALVLAVAIDLAVDGLLAGLTLAGGLQGGLVIVGALTLEVLFLGLSVLVSLRRRGLAARTGLAVLALLAPALPAGALAGAALLAALPAQVGVAVLAFATAALLYLVFEELLAEAHEEGRDSTATTAMLFLGFLLVLLIKAFLE